MPLDWTMKPTKAAMATRPCWQRQRREPERTQLNEENESTSVRVSGELMSSVGGKSQLSSHLDLSVAEPADRRLLASVLGRLLDEAERVVEACYTAETLR